MAGEICLLCGLDHPGKIRGGIVRGVRCWQHRRPTWAPTAALVSSSTLRSVRLAAREYARRTPLDIDLSLV